MLLGESKGEETSKPDQEQGKSPKPTQSNKNSTINP